MNNDQSHALFTRAQTLLPGGVNSPVRAFKSVGGEPFFVKRADGPYLYDVDDNRYIDFSSGIYVTTLGHCHPKISEAVARHAGTLPINNAAHRIPASSVHSYSLGHDIGKSSP